MGKIKYIHKLRKFFKKNPVVNITSIKNLIVSYGGKKNYTYLLINYLLKKREIKRITKSFYTIYEDPAIVVFCFKPAYVGLQDALSIHDLWEQETNPVIITTKKARQGVRKIFNTNVIIKRISLKYFFGFKYMKQDNFYIPVSDVEKTFIDMVYFNQGLDKNLLKNFKEKIDIKKLKKYLEKYPKRTSNKVLKLILNINSLSLKRLIKPTQE